MALTDKQRKMADYIIGTRATAPANVADQHPELFDAWKNGETVAAGDRRSYAGMTYEAVQSHTTQADWRPDATPALWKRVYEGEWPGWVQPTGAHDAYAAGAKVTHGGKRWTSDVDSNVWEPGVYGWTEF